MEALIGLLHLFYSLKEWLCNDMYAIIRMKIKYRPNNV